MEQAEREILDSWDANSAAWVRAVRQGRIESRRLATDEAIVAAVTAHRPSRVLDLGCGEGWLCRTLARSGIDCVGIDASVPLIAAARQSDAGNYHVCPYSEIAQLSARLGRFEVISCNFSLLAKELSPLLDSLHELLESTGTLIVQTVHPWTSCSDSAYEDHWRSETFAAFDGEFSAMPWYFRTMESWLRILDDSAWSVVRLTEPRPAQSPRPLSMILEAVARAGR
jgi:2-polyprenyl-3-methyl-5-hydroxy-6-metoxy-1,4-benzoquinol methylase